jgi:hypothetical protein
MAAPVERVSCCTRVSIRALAGEKTSDRPGIMVVTVSVAE